ncbi:GNAT family N-acetyltransferase [bacterium]|nr:GNAT family N-acetyltransferase [bacterium]
MLNSYGQKSPIKFKRVINTEYLAEISELYNKYIENLEDDFSPLRSSPQKLTDYTIKTSPYFYVILSDNNFCGFIVLENIVGNKNHIHSAEVLICLKRKYWGKTALLAAKIFKQYCFSILKIVKLKALIYPQNSLIKRLLKKCGFKKEALLKSETLKNNKPQDIEIYVLFNKEKGGSNAL